MNDHSYDHDGYLIEEVVDHGDGTATVTDYTTDPPTVTTITVEGWTPPPLPTDTRDLRDITTPPRTEP